MPMIQDRIQIELLGETFTVKGDSSGSEIRKVSGFLEEQLASLSTRYPALSAKKLAVLALFHLADDLLRVRRDYEALIALLEKD